MNRWWSIPLAISLLPACDMVTVRTSGAFASNGPPPPRYAYRSPPPQPPPPPPNNAAPAQPPGASQPSPRQIAAAEARARREARRDAAQQLAHAKQLRQELDALAKGDAAIPDAKIAELIEAGATLDDPKAARRFLHLGTAYRLEAAWKNPDAEAAKAVAQTLGGEVAASGRTTGGAKQLKVTWAAEKGVCYTAFMRWATSTGQEQIKSINIDYPGNGSSPLQTYDVPSTAQVAGEQIWGACATDKTQVTLSAELTYAGTRNGVRYAVVATPKDKFPLYVSTYLSANLGDACDTEAWYRTWADPIPGSVLYSGAEPFLMLSPDRAGQMWNTLANATFGTSVRIQKKNLASAPAGPVKFGTQFKFPGCPTDGARYSESKRLQACHDAINAKYNPQLEALASARQHALTIAAYNQAVAARDRLNQLADDEDTRMCGPIQKGIEKKWQAAYDKIVDLYTDHPYASPVRRAEELDGQDYD